MNPNPALNGHAQQASGMPLRQATVPMRMPGVFLPFAASIPSSALSSLAPQMQSGCEESESLLPGEPSARRVRLNRVPALHAGQSQAGATDSGPSSLESMAPQEEGSAQAPEPGTASEAQRDVDNCMAAAKRGDAAAQYRLARMLEQGAGVPRDGQQAVAWYRRAAQAGNAEAQHALGRMSLQGQGMKANAVEALHWFNEAMRQGHAGAMCALGVMYQNGSGVSRNPARARELIDKAADLGCAAAQCHLGHLYRAGGVQDPDMPKAIECYRKAMQGGNIAAHRALAELYCHGWGVRRDRREALHLHCRAARRIHEAAQPGAGAGPATAPNTMESWSLQRELEWCREAALRGDAEAQFCLAFACDIGAIGEMDTQQAFRWASDAARQGHALGQCLLGRFHMHGTGVDKDEKLALEWLNRAAAQDCAEAHFLLGKVYGVQAQKFATSAFTTSIEAHRRASKEMFGPSLASYKSAAAHLHAGGQAGLADCFEGGRGVKACRKSALAWYRKAAHQGDAHAQYRLACKYESGEDVGKNLQQALYWYQKAAERDSADAQYVIAKRYLSGSFVPRDASIAFEWMRRAAENGHVKAMQQVARMYRSGEYGEAAHGKAMQWLLAFRQKLYSHMPDCLMLHSLKLDTRQLRYLPELIGTGHSWKLLDLMKNAIDDDGAREVARLIRRDTRLRTLQLQLNRFGVPGLREIAQAMRGNISLSGGRFDDYSGNEEMMRYMQRIREEFARNLRLGNLLPLWDAASVEDGTYCLPAELVRLLGAALILQDQKFNTTQFSEEETRLRLALLLLSLQELAYVQWAMERG